MTTIETLKADVQEALMCLAYFDDRARQARAQGRSEDAIVAQSAYDDSARALGRAQRDLYRATHA